MEIESKTYFKMMKELDRILPSTVRLDYTKISPEELWLNVRKFLDSVGLSKSISVEELENLQNKIMNMQRNIYNKKTNLLYKTDNVGLGFDQNNHTIKAQIVEMRVMLMGLIVSKQTKYSMTGEYRDFYDEKMGSVNEIKESINRDAIAKYVTETLTISKEDQDMYNLNPHLIAESILLHYGYKCDEDDEVINIIEGLIDDAIRKSTEMQGERHSWGYDSASQNSQTFNEKINESIQKIVYYIERLTNKMLDERIKIDEKRKEASRPMQEQGGRITEQSVPSPYDGSIGKDTFEMMSKYDKMKKLTERNNEILSEIAKCSEEISRLMKEFEANSAVLNGGGPRGIK